MSFLVPLMSVVAYQRGLARQNAGLEAMGLRKTRTADIALGGMCVACHAAILLLDRGEVTLATVRNAAGYFGATLLGSRLIGLTAASLIPVVWAILAGMGGLPWGDPAIVAWPAQPAASGWSWAVAAGLAVAGPLAYARGLRTL